MAVMNPVHQVWLRVLYHHPYHSRYNIFMEKKSQKPTVWSTVIKNSSESLWLNTNKSVQICFSQCSPYFISIHQWIQETCLYHVSYEAQYLNMILGIPLRYGMSDWQRICIYLHGPCLPNLRRNASLRISFICPSFFAFLEYRFLSCTHMC